MWRSSTRAGAEKFRWQRVSSAVDLGPDQHNAVLNKVLEIFKDNVTHLGGWWAFVTRHLNLKKSHGGDQHQ